MKKILSLVVSLILLSALTLTSLALDGFFVFDEADYLTDEALQRIDEALTRFDSDSEHSIYLLTKYDPYSPYDTNEYTKNFIDVNGLGLDGKTGIVAVLDLDKEVHAIYNFGKGSKTVFSNEFVTAFNYSLTNAYMENDYEEAFIDAIENTVSYFENRTYSFKYSQTQPETAVPTTDKRYIADDADLLTDAQEAELLSLISRINFYHDIDVVLHTTNDIGNKDIGTYANDYYDYNGYADDGMLFMIDMGSRNYYTSTTGYAMVAFADDKIESLSDTVVGYLSDGEYYEAFTVYLNNVDGYLEAIHNESELDYRFDDSYGVSTSKNILKRELVSIAVAFIISFIVVSVLQKKMNTAVRKTQANDYLVPNSLNITAGNDFYITSNIVRVPKQTNNTKSGGSHVSSGGRAHGGGGGRF